MITAVEVLLDESSDLQQGVHHSHTAAAHLTGPDSSLWRLLCTSQPVNRCRGLAAKMLALTGWQWWMVCKASGHMLLSSQQ